MFKKVKDKLRNNKALMISLVAGLIILIGGVSYAAYDYSFTGKDSKLESGSVSIKFLESNTNVIDLKNALPISDSEGKKGDSFDFAVTTKASYKTGLKYDLSVEKLSVDSGYTSLSDNQIKVYLTDYNNKELVSPTLISNLSDKLLYRKTNKHSSTNTSITDKYKLRVWVDYNVDSSSWNKDSKFSYKFKIGIKSNEVEPSVDTSGANKPVLDSGMIPVYYDETSESWKKADVNNAGSNWYNYDTKKWANSVTVSSTNRSKYQSASVGTEIPMDDILTMQVWIPRYKYKVWNYNADGTVSSNEQQIEITFENGTNTTGEISCQDAISGTDGDPSETCKLKSINATCTDSTCNNKTYTHPAFTFGNEEIKGFWIGKFELTGTISSITTKPNLSSLRNQKVSSFETNIMNMKNSGNKYGLNTTTDTHMIKNMEWGAVAYLSHSKYGTCTSGTCREVNINNSSGYYTGRSGGNSVASGSLEGEYGYNQTSKTETILNGNEINMLHTNDADYPWSESNGLYKSTNEMGSESNLKFDFEVNKDNTYLSFDWSAITDKATWAYLYYTIKKDGIVLSDTGEDTKIGGAGFGSSEDSLTYQSISRKLEPGTYELIFTFRIGRSLSGSDVGYVKNINVIENPIKKEENIILEKGKDGPSASTTHNIYGVYDMSGGAYEYTMGNMISSDGTTMMSGFSRSTNSGYSGITGEGMYAGDTYPNEKYYDKYSFNTSESGVQNSKLGDSIRETNKQSYRNWYNDNSLSLRETWSWFLRGDCFNGASRAGLFASSANDGSLSSFNSTRFIITP